MLTSTGGETSVLQPVVNQAQKPPQGICASQGSSQQSIFTNVLQSTPLPIVVPLLFDMGSAVGGQ